MSNVVAYRGFAPQSMAEAVQFSEMLSKSEMVPKQYQNKPQDILVAVQWGYEIGLAPMQALQNISVINGRPSVYGDAAMALVQASPVCEDIQEFFEGEGTNNPIAVCIAKRKGRTAVTAKFSVEDAKRAGLWDKQGPWKQYTKRMLQMRARGFALRDAFPDVLKGLITAEEAMDYPTDEVKVAVKPVPQIEITDELEPQEDDSEYMPFYVPNPDGSLKLYAKCKTDDEWKETYRDMCYKINNSKLAEDVKLNKLYDLQAANEDLLKKFFDNVER